MSTEGEQDDDFTAVLPEQLIKQFQEGLATAERNGNVSAALKTLDEFQVSPQFLDSILEKTVQRLAGYYDTRDSYNTLLWPYQVLYGLFKVRGHKVVSRFLPVNVELLDEVVDALEHTEKGPWQRRYCLLIWLSMLILVPIRLSTFGDALDQRIYDMAMKYLGVSGLERDAAYLVMARLITRTDTIDSFMPVFYKLGVSLWTSEPGSSSNSANSMLRLGFLQASSMILKLCDFATVRTYCKVWFDALISHDPTKDSALYRKYFVKNIERYALLCLRYNQSDAAQDEQQFNESMDIVEHVFDTLFERLADKDTVVRYSTSKSIARMIQGLPDADFADQILEILFSKFNDDVLIKTSGEKDFQQVSGNRWHGLLLSIAECLRRKLILAERHFDTLTSILKQSLCFEQKQLASFSLGSNVRDASCYVCWAMFRSYRSISRATVDGLIESLVCLCCYDREVSIRRAAGAAIQEGVGRHGLGDTESDTNRAVELVKEVDFFKLGLRSHSFMVTAVAAYRLGYRGVVDYGLNNTLLSCYSDIRRLVSASLAKIAESYAETGIDQALLAKLMYKSKNVATLDVDAIHGILYCLGEILNVTTDISRADAVSILETLEGVSDTDLTSVNEVLYSDGFAHLFAYFTKFISRLGSDERDRFQLLVSKKASLTLIRRKVNQRKSLFTNFSSDPDQKSILDSMCHAVQSIPSQFLDTEILNDWISEIECNSRPQFAVVFGYFKLRESETAELILNFFSNSVTSAKTNPEMKAVLISSLGTLITDNPAYKQGLGVPYQREVQAILQGLDTFVINKVRGDIGSLVRIASIESCMKILPLMGDRKTFYSRLIRMSMEPLDKVRLVAAKALQQCKPTFLETNGDSILKDLLDDIESWPSKEYFYHIIRIWDQLYPLEDDVYRSQYVLGLVRLGGATHASAIVLQEVPKALIEYLHKLERNGNNEAKWELLQRMLRHMDATKGKIRIGESALILWSKLAESGYEIPASCRQELVERVAELVNEQNSIILSRDIIRLLSVLAVGGGKHAKQSLQVLSRYLRYDNAPIRELASEAIFEFCMNICNENAEAIVELMGEIDWTHTTDPELLDKLAGLIQDLDLDGMESQ